MGIKYRLYPSHSNSLVFVLQVLLLPFAKDTVGISCALKNANFSFPGVRKSQQPVVLLLWKLTLESRLFCRQIHLLNLSKTSEKATTNMGSFE